MTLERFPIIQIISNFGRSSLMYNKQHILISYHIKIQFQFNVLTDNDLHIRTFLELTRASACCNLRTVLSLRISQVYLAPGLDRSQTSTAREHQSGQLVWFCMKHHNRFVKRRGTWSVCLCLSLYQCRLIVADQVTGESFILQHLWSLTAG